MKKEVHAEELKVVGSLPKGLEGVFARTGPNPEQLAGDYHWCVDVVSARFAPEAGPDCGHASYALAWAYYARTQHSDSHAVFGLQSWL